MDEPITTDEQTASAEKEMGMAVESAMHYPYFGVTSFAELEDIQESEMAAKRVKDLGDMFQAIAGNIVADGEVTDKAGSLSKLVTEYRTRLDTLTAQKSKEQAEAEPVQDPANVLTVWKEASGRWRWFAVYSNRYRDQDTPPEIISEKSHKTFLDMVDKGLVPYPELWHWHIPGTRWGVADWLDYADGFALASGTVDEGHEKEAAKLAEAPIPIRVSHGMPEKFIWRNIDDPSIIDFHITKEISDLPSPAAANPLTGFELFKGAGEMALAKDKRQYLRDVAGLPEDAIARIEAGLASKAKEAEDAGLEFKEAEAVEETVKEEIAAVQPATDEKAEPVKVEAANLPAEAPVTRAEIAEALGQVVEGFTAQMRALTENMQTLTTTVKELQQPDEERIAQKAADTPPASLAALIAQRVIGAEAAKVDGRSGLAKSKPVEAQTQVAGPTPYDFLNTLIDASRSGPSNQ